MAQENTELFYTIRYLNSISKKRVNTMWKMTEAEAAKRFAGHEYEIVWSSKEERRVGGDWRANSTSALLDTRDLTLAKK